MTKRVSKRKTKHKETMRYASKEEVAKVNAQYLKRIEDILKKATEQYGCLLGFEELDENKLKEKLKEAKNGFRKNVG